MIKNNQYTVKCHDGDVKINANALWLLPMLESQIGDGNKSKELYLPIPDKINIDDDSTIDDDFKEVHPMLSRRVMSNVDDKSEYLNAGIVQIIVWYCEYHANDIELKKTLEECKKSNDTFMKQNKVRDEKQSEKQNETSDNNGDSETGGKIKCVGDLLYVKEISELDKKILNDIINIENDEKRLYTLLCLYVASSFFGFNLMAFTYVIAKVLADSCLNKLPSEALDAFFKQKTALYCNENSEDTTNNTKDVGVNSVGVNSSNVNDVPMNNVNSDAEDMDIDDILNESDEMNDA